MFLDWSGWRGAGQLDALARIEPAIFCSWSLKGASSKPTLELAPILFSHQYRSLGAGTDIFVGFPTDTYYLFCSSAEINST